MLDFNGINVQRRKLYPNNPRNNMVSTVALDWQSSVAEESTPASPKLQLEMRKNIEHQKLQEHYNNLIENKLEETLRLEQNNKIKLYQQNPAALEETLHAELKNYENREMPSYSVVQRVPPGRYASGPRKSELGNAVFGYNIEDALLYNRSSVLSNANPIKQESYLKKYIEDRLSSQNQQPSRSNSSASIYTSSLKQATPIASSSKPPVNYHMGITGSQPIQY